MSPIGKIKWLKNGYGYQKIDLGRSYTGPFSDNSQTFKGYSLDRSYVKVWYRSPVSGPIVIDRALTVKAARRRMNDEVLV